MVKEVEDFDRDVLAAERPVLVKFWAPWCGPCKQLAPLVEELANELEEVVVAKVNIDDHPDVPPRYGLRGVPAFLVFRGGHVVGQHLGSAGRDQLRRLIGEAVR